MRRPVRARGIGAALCVVGLASQPSLFTRAANAGSLESATPAPEPPRAAAAPIDLGACVDLEEVDDDDGVAVRLRSGCERALRCEVTWALRCQASPTDAHAGSASFRLDPGASHVTRARATACGDDGWSVDDVRWNCVVTRS